MPAPTTADTAETTETITAETITAERITETDAGLDHPTASSTGPAAPTARRRRGPITLLVGLAVLSTLLLFALAVVALTDGGEAVDPDPVTST